MASTPSTSSSAPSAPSQTAPLKPVSTSPGAFSAASFHRSSETQYLKLLVYGPHGGGKTTLLCSACDVEDMRDVLLVTIEGGMIVLEDNDRIKAPEWLDIIKIERIEQLQKVADMLKTHVAWRDDPTKEDKLLELQATIGLDSSRIRRFRTVIIDSLSEVEAMNLAKILNLDAIGLDAGDDMEVAGFPQFRKNMHLMQRIVRRFRDMPMHVLITCAQSFTQDERKAYHYAPKLTGQLTGIIQGFFDVVGWLVPNAAAVDPTTGIAKRFLFVQPQTVPKADAKCRLASHKAAYFEDPTMLTIMQQTGMLKKKG